MRIVILLQDNAIFAISNYQKNCLMLAHNIMLWFVCMFYFFFIIFNKKKTLRANWFVIYFKLFGSLCYRWKIHFFHSYWLKNGLTFDILFGLFLIFSWSSATVIAYWKQLSSLFSGFIVVFIFYSVKRIYVWSNAVQTYFTTFGIQ